MQQGLVVLEDGRLALGNFTNSKWLCDELHNGDTEAWSFVEANYAQKYARKFDDEHLKKIGLEGEKWVLEQYKSSLGTEFVGGVRQVSLTDDTLGFDIVTSSLRYRGQYIHIEVKTTVRASPRFEFYLSRNEYEVGLKDPKWVLLLVRKQSGLFEVFGHVHHGSLVNLVPEDVDKSGSWASAKLSLDSSDVHNSLP